MPQFVITAPNGKKYKVTAPDGATAEQAAAMVAQQHPEASQPSEKPKSFWQGVAEGAYQPLSNIAHFMAQGALPGVKQLATAGLDLVDSYQHQGVKASPNRGSTLGKIVGGTAATAPLAVAGSGLPLLAQGAVQGAVMTDNPKNAAHIARDAAIGAATNWVVGTAAKKVVAPAARKLADIIKGTPEPVPPANPLAPLGQDAIDRAAQLQRVGVTNPTTGMVTRDPAAWYAEQEGLKRIGVGEPILNAYKQADDQLRAAAMKLTAGYGKDTAEESGKIVQDALSAKNKALQAGVSALYDQVRSTSGDVPVGRLGGFREFINSPDVTDNSAFDAMRSSVLRRLDRLGLGQGEAQVSVKQVEELRKFIGNLGSSTDPAVRYMRGQMTNALDDDVVNSVGSDAFKAARDAAKARFDEFSKTFAGDIVQGKFGTENVVSRSLSGARPIADVRQLVGSLQNSPEALNTLRQQTLADVINPALGPEGAPRAATLRSSITNNAPKLREILTPEQMNQLNDLMGAASNVGSAVPRSNVNYSNTASTLANLFPDVPENSGSLGRAMVRGATRLGSTLGGAIAGGPGGAVVGYGAGESANAAVNTLLRKKAAAAAAQQLLYASDPAAAAKAVWERTLADEMARRTAQYGTVISGLLAPPAAASAITLSQQ